MADSHSHQFAPSAFSIRALLDPNSHSLQFCLTFQLRKTSIWVIIYLKARSSCLTLGIFANTS